MAEANTEPDTWLNFETEDEFIKWFWKKKNGNTLIKKLNEYPIKNRGGDFIRREKETATIYAIVINDGVQFPSGCKWKLVKVGFTQSGTEPGTNNRMEQVKKEIEKTEYEAGILFVLPIGAVDTTSFHKTEKRIREKVGTPVPKKKAKALGLPFTTEWVVTTEAHIKKIKKEIDNGEDIDLFKVNRPAGKPVITAPIQPKAIQFKKWVASSSAKK